MFVCSIGWPDDVSSHKHSKTRDSSKGSASLQHHKSSGHNTDAEKSPSPKPSPEKRKADQPPPEPGPSGTPAPANVASMRPDNIREFDKQPPKVQQLIRNALALTERNLTYKYGSSDPSEGGMDCSGFIYYVLTESGFKDVPRDSSGQYAWIRQNSDFHAVLSRNLQSFEFGDLKAGDLMFWSGTYRVSREFPITHVMIYLGMEKSAKKPVMVGSSDGRSYDGIQRNGVSVFDFKMPSGEPKSSDPVLIARFEGYGTIPGLREAASKSEAKNLRESAPERNINQAPKPKTEPLGNGD